MSFAADRDRPELSEAARRLLERYAALGRFSGVAMVARGGRTVLAVASGSADGAAGRPLAVDDRFALGSLSKQFTAAAVLERAAAGALGLGDPIGRHLGDLALPFGGAVTIEHLLSHRSGIPSLFKPHLGVELPDARAAQPATRAELCQVFAHLPLRFPPGTRVEYSNSGYALLAIVVERTSGLSWEDYLRERLLGPAGLTRTSPLRQAGDVTGHLAGQPTSLAHPSWLVGSGDLIGPAGDLLLWDRAPAGTAVRARALGGADGGGLMATMRRGRRVLQHDGALAGFVGTYHHLPDDELAVVVLTNAVPGWPHMPVASRTVNQIAEQLADLALGAAPEAGPPALRAPTPAELTRCAGRYQAGPLELIVRPRGTRLWAETGGARPWTLWSLAKLAGLDDTPRAKRVASFLAAMTEQRYPDAVAEFAPENARSLAPEALEGVWRSLSWRVGGPPTLRLIQVLGDVGYLRAMGAPLDARVAFDDSDHLVGFHVVAPGVGAASPTVELLPAEPPGRFVSDGYTLGVPDLELSFSGGTGGTGAGERAEALTVHTGEGFHFTRVG